MVATHHQPLISSGPATAPDIHFLADDSQMCMSSPDLSYQLPGTHIQLSAQCLHLKSNRQLELPTSHTRPGCDPRIGSSYSLPSAEHGNAILPAALVKPLEWGEQTQCPLVTLPALPSLTHAGPLTARASLALAQSLTQSRGSVSLG